MNIRIILIILALHISKASFAQNEPQVQWLNFEQLEDSLAIKPKRVAARSKTKWKEYEVDSAATRVVVNEDGSEVLDLIIGKY